MSNEWSSHQSNLGIGLKGKTPSCKVQNCSGCQGVWGKSALEMEKYSNELSIELAYWNNLIDRIDVMLQSDKSGNSGVQRGRSMGVDWLLTVCNFQVLSPSPRSRAKLLKIVYTIILE